MVTGSLVRKATKGDLEELQALKREVSTMILLRSGHTLEQIGAWHANYVHHEYFLKHVRAPHSMFVIEDEGAIKGMASVSLKEDGDTSWAYLGNLYCYESDRGYGGLLMAHRLAVISMFNVEYLQCHVHIENEKAQRFVERHGFEKHDHYIEADLGNIQIVYRKIAET